MRIHTKNRRLLRLILSNPPIPGSSCSSGRGCPAGAGVGTISPHQSASPWGEALRIAMGDCHGAEAPRNDRIFLRRRRRASPLGKLSPVRRLVTEEVKTSPTPLRGHPPQRGGHGRSRASRKRVTPPVFAVPRPLCAKGAVAAVRRRLGDCQSLRPCGATQGRLGCLLFCHRHDGFYMGTAREEVCGQGIF